MRRQLALAIVSAQPAPGALRPFLLGILGIVVVALLLAPRGAEACAMRYRPDPAEELIAENPAPSLEEVFAQIDAPVEPPAQQAPAQEPPAQEPAPEPKPAQPQS